MPLTLRTRTLAASLAMVGSLAVPAAVDAASATSLYEYDLRSSSPYLNSAPQNGSVPMAFHGDWSSTSDGVVFTGNTSGTRSVGVADPASGATIDVASMAAVGAVIDFTLGKCSSDSDNLTQIGRFAAGQAQLKLQLSSCSGGVAKPQCRVAGSKTPAGTRPVTGSGTVATGKRYQLECIKSPDSGSSATLTIRLTDVSTGVTTTKTATIPDTGRITSSKPLSVANKYPLPKAQKNTDQFNGTVRRVEVCTGSTVSTVRACLG